LLGSCGCRYTVDSGLVLVDLKYCRVSPRQTRRQQPPRGTGARQAITKPHL
jgi:hypothetical protein